MPKITKKGALSLTSISIVNLFVFWWLFHQWKISVWTFKGFIMSINCSLGAIVSALFVLVLVDLGKQEDKVR